MPSITGGNQWRCSPSICPAPSQTSPWIGCVVAPKGIWPDGVASVSDGGIIVTSLWDPTVAQRMDKLMNGKPTGALDEWHPGKGWHEVPGSSGMSGPNGVIVSPDGREVYVAVWSGREAARFSRARQSRTRTQWRQASSPTLCAGRLTGT
jgi:sugar lactone lactonase YvrE